MHTKCGAYNATVEKYFGCVCKWLKCNNGGLEIVLVIQGEGTHPNLDFLMRIIRNEHGGSAEDIYLLCRHGSFSIGSVLLYHAECCRFFESLL